MLYQNLDGLQRTSNTYCTNLFSYVPNNNVIFSINPKLCLQLWVQIFCYCLLGVIFIFSLFVIFARGTLTLGTYDV
jgi:hypothetical protein